MNKKDINESIDIIIKNEQSDDTINWIAINDEVRKADNLGYMNDLPRSIDIEKSHILKSKNFDLLKSLENRLNDTEKNIYYKSLGRYLIELNNYSLPFIYLFYKKGVDLVLDLIEINNNHSEKYLFDVLIALLEIIIYDHFILDKSDLNRILRFTEIIKEADIEFQAPFLSVNEIEEILDEINSNIDDIKYHRLSQDLLSGINFQINQDKEEVIHYLNTFGFNAKLIENIKYVDKMYLGASSDFDYKACADNIRSFTSAFIKEVALKVAQISKDEQPSNKYHIYLGQKKFFSSKQELDLYQSFRNYLSTESVHQLDSEKEVARISKNIAIEFALCTSSK